MRVWRAMKASGAAALRDGVWLLPAHSPSVAVFAELAAELQSAGGSAEVLTLTAADEAQQRRFRALFDRTAEYTRLLQAIHEVQRGLTQPPAAARQLAQLRKEYQQLVAVDFFPDGAGQELEAALLELERVLSPDEPRAQAAAVPRLDAADYRGRLWATRARPWVDRLACAWLIARFIDRKARFLWFASPADCPPEALGFDFDGAAFTHVGEAGRDERVTFEVLLESFGLGGDPALARLARIVHTLDVGGAAAEAAGLECLLRGMRQRIRDDAALLRSARRLFDDLYRSFSEEPQ